MQLHRICYVLPADSGEILQLGHQKPAKEEKKKKKKKQAHGGCGRQLLGFLGSSIRRVYASRWVFSCPHDVARRQGSGLFHDLAGVQVLEKVGGDNPRIFNYSELYIGSKGFSEDEVLGSGGFGRVYRAVLPSDDTVVAVKCLAEKGEQFEKTFAAELMAVAHLRHRNLVRLRGWCVHEDQLLLVYDYMPNRSLDRVLFRRPENPAGAATLGWDRRRTIVRGLAAALFYLHEQLETQIIHRDVKSSNVMLDSQYNARLGDFGLARWLEHEVEYQYKSPPPTKKNQFRLADTTKIGGTIGYLPPESFQKRSVATAKSDVFSFGIVVLEVVSGRRAVDLTFPDDQIILLDSIRRLSDEGRLLQAGDTRLTDGSYNRLDDMEHFLHVGLLCTAHNPQLRPNMKWVLEMLCDNNKDPAPLPALPSFQSHPLYISLSSSQSNTGASNTTTRSPVRTSTTTTDSSASTAYVTATGESIYETAEVDILDKPILSKSYRRATSFFGIDTPREISFKEIISATNNFTDSNRIAEVDFGTAYSGFLDNQHHVLVKRLGNTKCPALRTRFANELQNLAKLRHRNLVQLRGWCTEQGEMLVVYDYLSSRLLSHLLFHHDNRIGHSILLWHHRYCIIKSLASAIFYLHEEWDEQVIHRNITSSAVCLDQEITARLGSFALAEFLTRNDQAHQAASKGSKSSVRGIFGYMAPEYMESGEATPMTDVYSFGVLVLEVVTGQMAVDLRRPEALLVKRVHEFEANRRALRELVDMRLDGKYNNRELQRLIRLGIVCTRSNPELRPSMGQIVRIVDGHDEHFTDEGRRKESREYWGKRNSCSLSLVRRMHALGIQ